MQKHQDNLLAGRPGTSVTPMRGMKWGLMAGIFGTIAMDIALMGGLPAMGLPVNTCFSTIGSTVTRFFSILGIQLTGDVMLGTVAFHLIGPLLGVLYGLTVSQVTTLQRGTLKKNLIYAVLYAEVLSQLILTMTPILLKMSAHDTMTWFAGSFVLHLIWGLVLGFTMNYGLLAGCRARPALLDAID